MIGGGIDFASHHLGIGFIFIPPKRNLGLLMTGETGTGIFDQFPFAPTGKMDFVMPVIGVIIGEIVGGNFSFFVTHKIRTFSFIGLHFPVGKRIVLRDFQANL